MELKLLLKCLTLNLFYLLVSSKVKVNDCNEIISLLGDKYDENTISSCEVDENGQLKIL